MQVAERRIRYESRSDEFHLYTISCMHLGTKHCRERSLEKTIKAIEADPFALWVDLGDKGEFISPNDKRWDYNVISDWAHQDNIAVDQGNRYVELVSSIRNKSLGLHEGNHEYSCKQLNHVDVQSNICKALGLPNLGYSSFYRLIFERGNGRSNVFQVICAFTHGAGCAVTKGAKLTRLQRYMDAFDADIYAYGHVHDIIINTVPYLGVTREDKIEHKVKVGAMVGCWFSTYTKGVASSYGEQKVFPPTVLGCTKFTIKPDDRKITVDQYLAE